MDLYLILPLALTALALIFGLVAGVIARAKGQPFAPYFLLGFFLPLVGIIVAALAGRAAPGLTKGGAAKGCVYCGARLKPADLECRRCGRAQPVMPHTTAAAWEQAKADDEVARWADKNAQG